MSFEVTNKHAKYSFLKRVLFNTCVVDLAF